MMVKTPMSAKARKNLAEIVYRANLRIAMNRNERGA